MPIIYKFITGEKNLQEGRRVSILNPKGDTIKINKKNLRKLVRRRARAK